MRSRIWTPPEKQIWTPDDPEVGAVPCASWSPERVQCNMRGLALGLGLGLVFGGQNVNPLTIFGSAGVELWLRSDLGVTITGSGVSSWVDQSGKGDANRNVTQGTDANRPIFTASDANYAGQPSLKAATALRYLASGIWATPIVQPTTIFAAGVLVGGRLYDGSTLGGGREACLMQTAHWSMYAGLAVVEGTSNASLRKVCAIEFNGVTSKIYVTDPVTAEATGSIGTDGISRMGILNTHDGAAGASDSEIVEIVVTSGIATSGQRAACMNYMRARYGL